MFNKDFDTKHHFLIYAHSVIIKDIYSWMLNFIWPTVTYYDGATRIKHSFSNFIFYLRISITAYYIFMSKRCTCVSNRFIACKQIYLDAQLGDMLYFLCYNYRYRNINWAHIQCCYTVSFFNLKSYIERSNAIHKWFIHLPVV